MSKRQRRKRMERRNPDRLHYRMINLARTDRLLDALREGEARPFALAVCPTGWSALRRKSLRKSAKSLIAMPLQSRCNPFAAAGVVP